MNKKELEALKKKTILLPHIPYAGAKVKVFFAVKVVDSRQVFGREEFLVRPIMGRGEIWVKAKTLLSGGSL